MHEAGTSEHSAQGEAVVAVKDLGAFVRIALAGLLGAGVLITYWTMAFWVSGWRAHPRYAGYDWHDWLLLSMLSIGLISILAGMALSVNWLARARQMGGAILWGILTTVVLALTFVAVVAAVIDSTSFE